MIAPSAAYPAATQISARHAMAMAVARSATATRTNSAVTAHAMTEEPRSVVGMMLLKVAIYVTSTANHAVTGHAAIIETAKFAKMAPVLRPVRRICVKLMLKTREVRFTLNTRGILLQVIWGIFTIVR